MIGDFGLVVGVDKVGRLIRLAETLNGDGKSLYSHAFIIVDDQDDPTIVEAEIGGARYGKLSEYGKNVVVSSWPLDDPMRSRIVSSARSTIGTPYSALDYVSLALVHFHIRPHWLLNYVANGGHMICSQLVDYTYNRAGLNMFNDGRFFGDVTPQDLTQVLNGPQII